MEFVVRKQVVQIIIRIKDFQEHLRTSIRDKINFKNCECSFLHAKRGYGMCFIKHSYRYICDPHIPCIVYNMQICFLHFCLLDAFLKFAHHHNNTEMEIIITLF